VTSKGGAVTLQAEDLEALARRKVLVDRFKISQVGRNGKLLNRTKKAAPLHR